MMRGVSGSLLSLDALSQPGGATRQAAVQSALEARLRMLRWHEPLRDELGPATAARTCFDRVASRLFSDLGYRVVPVARTNECFRAVLHGADGVAAALLVTPWGQDPGNVWRDAVHLGIANDVRWTFICSGPRLRVVDSERTYSRRHTEFDLDATLRDEDAFGLLRRLFHAEAMSRPAAVRPLEQAILASEAHRASVRSSLQAGVFDALQHLVAAFAVAGRRRRGSGDDLLHESLVVIYRVLFLLFAEARGLVPRWHPVYRDAYTIESLRTPVEGHAQPPGIWEALQAIARLAHRGCRVGSLHVPAFNGHLFAPADAPLADSLPLDDRAVRDALLALTTRPARAGRVRIAYGELGVEQLGGVYERLLDFRPALDAGGRAPALVRAELRKRTGAFYTPRALTEYLVRRTLAPLVNGASPERILSLRVLDPAMGSGAFLVAACRFLAGAYEASLVADARVVPSELGPPERAGFRRAVAQRCLYGVDINPMAVQLGRLSLWLATLSADRPLTFLDHRLRAGNTLVGASPADVNRTPWSRTRTVRRPSALPLFGSDDLDRALVEAVGVRDAIASQPGDTLEQIRGKERALARLGSVDGALRRWRRLCDLWCSVWYLEGTNRARVTAAHGALADCILGKPSTLPDHLAEPLLVDAHDAAGRARFFHWPLEYPEAFVDADGQPHPAPGFDAVIGNPPWEMLRADRGAVEERASDRKSARCTIDFARASGVYRFQGGGHPNLYQLFLERSCQLVRRGGRLGLVLPGGFATDAGSAALRRMMFDRMELDGFVGIENRDGVFPIHRSLKFVLVSATAGGSTATIPARLGIRAPDMLERLPESGPDANALGIPRGLLERFSGPSLVVPDLRTPADLSILGDIAFTHPALGDPGGWNVRFGRELNASDDRGHFTSSPGGLPVVEGKQLRPFAIDLRAVRFRIPRRTASALLDAGRTFGRPRLAYRDVAAATNRLTLIAAIVPAGAVTTHTLFCLKDAVGDECQRFLCGVFNSYVANYLIRLQVGTHVSASIVERLPVPRPPRTSQDFAAIASDSGRLARARDDDAYARVQARVAKLYGLRKEQFERILETFPLVPRAERDRAMAAFCAIVS